MSKTYTVTGMSCDHCEQSVEEAVGALPGVESAEADNESDTLVVEGEPDDDAVATAVSDAGYELSA
ncbi:heavy-metal-associated domain-containing protein [Halarchaeum sp. P4]|uniref:heavy-metal-associated domain-containing protein n=1 Tax=Halarchaeum sp. P4 TaxID=3421639 RepID=UPI003EBA9E55